MCTLETVGKGRKETQCLSYASDTKQSKIDSGLLYIELEGEELIRFSHTQTSTVCVCGWRTIVKIGNVYT